MGLDAGPVRPLSVCGYLECRCSKFDFHHPQVIHFIVPYRPSIWLPNLDTKIFSLMIMTTHQSPRWKNPWWEMRSRCIVMSSARDVRKSPSDEPALLSSTKQDGFWTRYCCLSSWDYYCEINHRKQTCRRASMRWEGIWRALDHIVRSYQLFAEWWVSADWNSLNRSQDLPHQPDLRTIQHIGVLPKRGVNSMERINAS